MNREKLLDLIVETVQENVEVEEIEESSSFMDDLEMASIEIFAFIGELESKLGVVIPQKILSKAATVGELADEILKIL